MTIQKGELRANADHTSRRVAMTVLKCGDRLVMSPIVAFENFLESWGTTGEYEVTAGTLFVGKGQGPLGPVSPQTPSDLDIPCCADVAIARHDISAAPHFGLRGAFQSV